MNFGNLLVIIFLSYFSLHILTMIAFKDKRKVVQTTNKKLNKLRKVPVKTLEEQKEFINLKYPKKGKFKWTWKLIPKIIPRMATFVGIIFFYRWVFTMLGLELKLWQAILFIVVFPLILNILLEKFNIQKGDLKVFLR